MVLPHHGARLLAKIADVAVLALAIAVIAVPVFAMATQFEGGVVFLVLVCSIVLGSILTAFYTIVAGVATTAAPSASISPGCGWSASRVRASRFGQSVVRQLPMFLQVGWVDAMFALFTDAGSARSSCCRRRGWWRRRHPSYSSPPLLSEP